MLLTVTDSPSTAKRIFETAYPMDLFSYYLSFEDIGNTKLPLDGIRAVILDMSSDHSITYEDRARLKDLIQCLPTAVLTSEKSFPCERLIKADMIIDITKNDSALADFTEQLCAMPTSPISNGKLKLFPISRSISVWGYRLSLTPSELKIIRLLRSYSHRGFSRAEITNICFPWKSNAAVPVHICSINKKAQAISSRRLIVCDGNGHYQINENL